MTNPTPQNQATIKDGAYLCSAYEASLVEFGSYSGKIFSQIKALNKRGLNCSLETYDIPSNIVLKGIRWLPFTPTLETWPAPERISSYDYLYIRRPAFTKSFIRYLKQLKSLNDALKIIVEIPTYPYDQEATNLLKKFTIVKDRHYRKQLYKYVDRIADLSGHDSIFGIPTLAIINGIDLENVSIRTPSFHADIINILSVSGCQPWHGLDRVLYGFADYYAQNANSKPVVFHLVGDGPDLKKLKHLSSQLKINKYVKFYGELKQIEALKTYDSCTIAVECLGCHRKGVTRISSLKSREYFAKGIPFIFSTQLDVFENNPVDFCYRIPEDETPVNINEVIAFHDNLYHKYTEDALIQRIRTYAERNVSIDDVMKNVINFINE